MTGMRWTVQFHQNLSQACLHKAAAFCSDVRPQACIHSSPGRYAPQRSKDDLKLHTQAGRLSQACQVQMISRARCHLHATLPRQYLQHLPGVQLVIKQRKLSACKQRQLCCSAAVIPGQEAGARCHGAPGGRHPGCGVSPWRHILPGLLPQTEPAQAAWLGHRRSSHHGMLVLLAVATDTTDWMLMMQCMP